MRRNIDGTCSGDPCCKPRNIRTINTMNADTDGNFTVTGGPAVIITTVTNGIKIDYTGGLVYYTNTDGNLVIDPDNLTIDFAEDIVIAGDLTVNGTYYTVHAEHVYTEDDYIIMRDGATTALGSGQYSGFQVTKYDGTNDGRLVIDNTGTARVGDVGDEQPLLTRAETGSLTNGQSLVWDSANSKAITQSIPSDISTALAGKENTISPVLSQVALQQFGFTYGILKKYKINDKMYLYTVDNAYAPTGTYVVDSSITTTNPIYTTLVNGTNIRGSLSIGSSGVQIEVLAQDWLFGELFIVLP